MADDTTSTTVDDSDAATATDTLTDGTAQTDTLGDAGKQAIREERAKAKDALTRAKAAEAELAKVRKATMTDTEKAVTEAEERGRQSAVAAVGERLVRAEFRAQAAGRVEKLDEVLDDLNLAKFVDDEGEPDTKAIARAVARWAPAAPAEDTSRAPGPRPDLSQGGSRTTDSTALNSDALTQALTAAVSR